MEMSTWQNGRRDRENNVIELSNVSWYDVVVDCFLICLFCEGCRTDRMVSSPLVTVSFKGTTIFRYKLKFILDLA